ncbi:putative inorganic phosphate cotransporter [Trichonephila clavata]|uniref:Putative inorganic phosphate cotransporter n=1 Tax=Trichonephila clavata TaxID=2740835 RepID=A0A8X6HRF0_TRICU|nr:putative inorganic phosphate cotransporter [Trichonephila clavata]
MIDSSTECAEPSQKKCYLPARYVLTFLIITARCLEYAQKACLSVTIVVMVNHTALNLIENDTPSIDDTCEVPQTINVTTPKQEGEYLWTPSMQGIILGGYFYGFVCTQVVGGRLAEIAGGKWVMGLSVLIASLLTLVTPFAADIGVAAITIVRVMLGLAHGFAMPTAFAMFGHWAPLAERSTMLALCIVGDHVGTILTMPLAGYLCEHGFAGGWPSVFYILGMVGCVWFLFWIFLTYNKPKDHPRISQLEIDYIKKGQNHVANEQKTPVPWKKVFTSRAVWAIATVTFCSSWGFTTFLTKLPTYLEVVLHVAIQKNGLVNSLVYASSCLTLFISGALSDYMIAKKQMNATRVRKCFEILAMMGPAVCSALVTFVKCDVFEAIALLMVAMAFLGFSGGGHISIVPDVAPLHAASIFGLVNSIGCIAGIFSPMVAGFLLENQHSSIQQWSLVFYIASGFYVFGALSFTIFATAEKQPWASSSGTEKLLIPHLKDEKITLNKNGNIKSYGSTS